MHPALVRRRHAIEAARGKLEALSPMRVLERGFSLTQRADGHVVTSAADVQPGERITVRVHDGGIDATVDSVTSARNDPRRRAGRRRQQEPLARDPQRRVPRAGHRRRIRRLLGRAAAVSARWSPTCAREGYRYLNVTIPHKLAAARLATAPRARGARVGRREHAAVPARRRARREHRRRRPARRARRPRRRRSRRRRSSMAGAGGAAAGRAGGADPRRRAASAWSRAARRRARACARGCPPAAASRSRCRPGTATRWPRALAGATALVSAVPAAAWADAATAAGLARARRRRRRAGDGVRRATRRSRIACARSRRPLRRRPRHARPPGRARHQLALGKTPPLAPLFAAVRG